MNNTKRTILMPVWEGGGNVPPVLAAARKLLAAGHSVRILSDACNGPEVLATGAAFTAWTHAPSRPDKSAASDFLRDYEAPDPAEGLGRVIDRIMCGPAHAYATDTLQAIEEVRPDLVLTNELLMGPMVAAEAARLPFALYCPNISLAPMVGVPPLGPGLQPAKNVEEEALHAQIAAGNAALFNRGLPALNAARAKFGLPALGHVYEQWEKAEAVLLATARAFDFTPPVLPPGFSYVGPQFHDEASDKSWVSPWMQADARPLILVSFSTTAQGQAPALQRVIDAASGLPLRLLVTLGPALAGQDFVVPDNVRLVQRAPHRIVMRDAVAVVCHGGHGTVMRGLAQKRPLLVMPMGRDQNDNAARVAYHGAGLVADPARATKEEIATCLMRLIDEPGFAAAASRLGQNIGAEAMASPLIPLIEKICADLDSSPAAA